MDHVVGIYKNAEYRLKNAEYRLKNAEYRLKYTLLRVLHISSKFLRRFFVTTELSAFF